MLPSQNQVGIRIMKTLLNNQAVTKTLTAVAFSVAASVSMSAAADNYSETTVSTSAEGLQTMTISYADLDLSTAAAQETLYYRLSSAARKVCGSSDVRRTGSVRQAAENKSCYENTLAQALSQTTASQVATTD